MVLFSDILCYIGTPSSESAGREKRHDESQARAEEPLVIITYETISKRSSEFWLLIGHKRCFALPCPIGEQHLLSSFWAFVHDGYCDVILVLKLTQHCPVAAYCRQILLSLGTVGIFCWLLRGHQWWWVQAQLLYSSTDASPLFSCPNNFHFSLFFKSYSMVNWACDSSNTGYLVTRPIRIAYFKHVIALDQSEGWI